MTRHTTIYRRDILKVSTKEVTTEKQTFIENVTARGYETTPPSPTGNVTATKGDITVRLVPLADYIVDTPAVTAIVRKGATDAETMDMIAALTNQP